MERGLLVGIVAMRWAAWVWIAGVAGANLHRVRHPAVALIAVGLAGITSAAAHLAARRDRWRDALRPSRVGMELVVAIMLVAADGWVEQGRITGQTLAGMWPLAALLLASIAGGVRWGVLAGVALGGARVIAVAVGGAPQGGGGRAAMAVASTAVSWIVIGAVAGTIVRLLRQTQDQLAEVTVRERMARDLHDGVLQTLTLIERRSSSPEIARLARAQEVELRSYLFGDTQRPTTLAAALRRAAARHESTWPETSVTVSVTEDVPRLREADVDAVAGAVTEAMTNAAKHGSARNVFLFADLDEATGGLFLSVKDDGRGFDVAGVDRGHGLLHSVERRIGDVGGTVQVVSAPGEGCEIRMTVRAR